MIEAQKIICPNCKTEISVDDVLHTQIETEIRKQYETEKRKDAEYITAKEAELAKKAIEIEAEKRDVEITIANTVKAQLAQKEQEIQKQAKLNAENEAKSEIESLKFREQDLFSKLMAARAEQVQLMDDKKKLQDEKDAFEIEKRKQLDEERGKIKEEADKKAAEEYQTILAQRDKTIADTTQLNLELKRKLEQGSQQSQGEVAELNLEAMLGSAFIYDAIEPVPKGIRGADVIQKVRTNTGTNCGQIVWEVKNTKNWSEAWIQKLKDDQREIHADVAIIISSTLPEVVKGFALYNGVLVCDLKLAIPLATIIRDKLEAITREKVLAIGKNEKMEILYQYLTGTQFKQRIEAIVETFKVMKADLEAEKKYYIKKWAKTEKQIDKIVNNTVGMYGDFEGLVNLPKIQALELESEPEGIEGKFSV
jgi:hypothetical protein